MGDTEMRILNFGSLNIDKVYSVEHFVSAGETISSLRMDTFCGGKGLNQSVALASAGAQTYHAGAIGSDGAMLRELLNKSGADTGHLQVLEGQPSGHAVIQVDPNGQNCIIVCPGTNGEVREDFIDRVLADFSAGDILLTQNEISSAPYMMRQAKKKGMKIAFNASPISKELLSYPLELVDWFLVNEVEGKLLSGCPSEDYGEILNALHEKFPDAAIVLTVGADGVLYRCGDQTASHGIYRVDVVDTTAAGDTFCGFFLASLTKGFSADQALHYASLASAIAVSKKGAAPSVPTWDAVIEFEKTAVLRG